MDSTNTSIPTFHCQCITPKHTETRSDEMTIEAKVDIDVLVLERSLLYSQPRKITSSANGATTTNNRNAKNRSAPFR